MEVDALSDLFIRSVYLVLAVYAPTGTRLELRSTGCLDGWVEARDLFEHATGKAVDIDLMAADEKLCKGFGSPLLATGDTHLAGLAAKVTGVPAAADIGEPDQAAIDSAPASVFNIPFVSHSWFF
jgi:hypothetical protein